MNKSKKEKLKGAIIQSIVGSVSLVEIIQMLNSLADKEVTIQIDAATEEELENLYKEAFPES